MIDTSISYRTQCTASPYLQKYFWSHYMESLPSFVWDHRLQRTCILIWTPQTLYDTLGLQLDPHLLISIEQDRDAHLVIEEEPEPYTEENPIWLPTLDQLVALLPTSIAKGSSGILINTKHPYDQLLPMVESHLKTEAESDSEV